MDPVQLLWSLLAILFVIAWVYTLLVLADIDGKMAAAWFLFIGYIGILGGEFGSFLIAFLVPIGAVKALIYSRKKQVELSSLSSENAGEQKVESGEALPEKKGVAIHGRNTSLQNSLSHNEEHEKKSIVRKACVSVEDDSKNFRLASLVAKDCGVTESEIVSLIKIGRISGAIVNGYWRVDARARLDPSHIRAYLIEQAENQSSQTSATPAKKQDVEKVIGQEVAKEERAGVFDGEEPLEIEVVDQFLKSFAGQRDLSKHLSARDSDVLLSVARVLLEKGMAPGLAVDALSVLAEKHGGIRNLIASYSKAVKK